MQSYLIEYVKKIFDNYGDIEYSIDFSVSRGVIVKSRLDVAREIMFVFLDYLINLCKKALCSGILVNFVFYKTMYSYFKFYRKFFIFKAII